MQLSLDNMNTSDVTPPNIHAGSRRASRPTRLTTRSSSNTIAPGPASPEIISSLISSLSVISSPANNLFEGQFSTHSLSNPSASNGNGLNGKKVEPRTSRGSFGVEYGTYLQPRMDSFAGVSLDDLPASPPVIKTSKSPSGLSSVTAPKRAKSRDRSPFRSLLRGSSRPSSRDSSTSKDRESAGYFGSASIERGVQPSPDLTKKKSSDGWAKPQIRSSKSLIYMSSRERLREAFQDKSRANPASPGLMSTASLDRLSLPTLPPFESESFMASNPINEEAVADVNPNYGPASPEIGGIADGKVIPPRGSSLRKSSSRKRSSQRDSRTHERRESDAAENTIPELDERQDRKKESIDGFRRRDSTTRGLDDMVVQSTDLGERAAKSDQNRGRRKPSVDRRSGAITPEMSTDYPQRTKSKLKRSSAPNSPPQKGLDPQHRSTWQAGSTTGVSSPEPKLSRSYTDDRPSSSDSIDDAVDAWLRSPRLSQTCYDHRTGRAISFSEVGDSEGYAVFCCVGMGLTRYIMSFYDELAATLKLRLITPDRPGVGDSQPYSDGTSTPLSWPDDVYTICQTLKIEKFSLLAHSAGAIYALATALRMPQHIRTRVHLLAPWIPPSQMSVFGKSQDQPPSNSLPTSQRILRALPTPILKVANSSFMSTTSASVTSSLPKNSKRTKRKTAAAKEAKEAREAKENRDFSASVNKQLTLTKDPDNRDSLFFPNPADRDGAPFERPSPTNEDPNSRSAQAAQAAQTLATQARQRLYDNRLTHAIWELATSNANPAIDLLVCLERRHTIGFRYVDITKNIVIHHGSRDSRVPVENVKWLGKTMKNCEVRILEGEGHGLMASALTMGNVLTEIATEWDAWTKLTMMQSEPSSGKTLRSRASAAALKEWGNSTV